MSLPTSYLTTTKNLGAIFSAIQGAKAPAKFAQSFLEGLGFKNKTDRLVIGLLKSLGFLSDGGEPTQRYFEFLDQSQGQGGTGGTDNAERLSVCDLSDIRPSQSSLLPTSARFTKKV